MIYFDDQRTLPYSAQQMYNLVLDVKSYPEFVVGCESIAIHECLQDLMRVELGVGFGPLQARYISDIQFKPDEFIQAHCHTKPFKHMINTWSFMPQGQGSLVKFHIEFEFQRSLFNKITSRVFLSLSQEIMDSFIKRAEKIYNQ